MDAITVRSPQQLVCDAFVPTSAALVDGPATAETLRNEFRLWGDEPIELKRTRRSRSESAFRYDNAEQFFRSVEDGYVNERYDMLYRIGIVCQLGLSSWLFKVGFTDEWCRNNIGLKIAKSLGYANATGLGYYDLDTSLLAAILTPYGKWRHPAPDSSHDSGPLSGIEMSKLTRGLLDHLRHAIGHSCQRSRV